MWVTQNQRILLHNHQEHFDYIYGDKIREGWVDEILRFSVPDDVRNRTSLTRSAQVLLNLVLVADCLRDWNHSLITSFSHIMAIHRGFPRDGDITEIITDPWQHKQSLQIFICNYVLAAHILRLYTNDCQNILAISVLPVKLI